MLGETFFGVLKGKILIGIFYMEMLKIIPFLDLYLFRNKTNNFFPISFVSFDSAGSGPFFEILTACSVLGPLRVLFSLLEIILIYTKKMLGFALNLSTIAWCKCANPPLQFNSAGVTP